MSNGGCKVRNDLGKNREGMRASGICPSWLILCLIVYTLALTHTCLCLRDGRAGRAVRSWGGEAQ